MNFEEPPKSRYRFRNESNSFVISIPSKKNWFMILFLGFWLIAWCVGEFTALATIFGGAVLGIAGGLGPSVKGTGLAAGGVFLVAWLGAWTVGGAFAIYIWLWQLKGVEEISFSPQALAIANKVPGWTREKSYRMENVKALRLAPYHFSPMDPSRGMEFWGITGGLLAFDYGSSTVRCGKGIEEAEAKEILGVLRQRLPSIVGIES
jgi:hypothetical protein